MPGISGGWKTPRVSFGTIDPEWNSESLIDTFWIGCVHRGIVMTKRKVEIFLAGCGICEETVKQVKELACSSCEVEVLSMQDSRGRPQGK